MSTRNINFNNEIRHSSHDFANRLLWTSAHLKSRTRSSRDMSLFCKIAGWSLAVFTLLGLFSYLTFVPEQAYAEYDWETRKLSDITTMQEMNAKICENTESGATKQLIDSREPSKKYWVAKLADGKCWMTQNLDFDIPENGKLLAAETDVAEDTNISAKKFTNGTTVANWHPSGDVAAGRNIIQYYDPGPMVKSNPAGTDNCYGEGKTALNQTDCINAGWQDVSDLTPETTTSSNGNNPEDTSNSVINGSTYDAHYLVGNYYSWNAATAGSGAEAGDTGGTQAANSICPKGWKLPTSSDKLGTDTTPNTIIPAGSGNSYDMAGSFAYIFRQYGLATAFNGGNVTTQNPSAIENNLTKGNTYNIYDAPLYYFRAGGVHSTYLTNAGHYGYYWSSVVYSDASAYRFGFSVGTSFGPSSTNARYLGMPVRCVNSDISPDPSTSDVSNVSIKVSPTISLDVRADAIVEDATFTTVSTSNIKANVSSNYQYVVSLSTDQPNLELATPVAEQHIPMIQAGEDVKAGTNGWGIMQKMSALDNTMLGSTVDNVNNAYSPVGIGDEQVVFYKSAEPEALTDQADPANPLVLKVGVGISPQLPSGTYSTTVTLTASTY